jgi:hypothetical protein
MVEICLAYVLSVDCCRVWVKLSWSDSVMVSKSSGSVHILKRFDRTEANALVLTL